MSNYANQASSWPSVLIQASKLSLWSLGRMSFYIKRLGLISTSNVSSRLEPLSHAIIFGSSQWPTKRLFSFALLVRARASNLFYSRCQRWRRVFATMRLCCQVLDASRTHHLVLKCQIVIALLQRRRTVLSSLIFILSFIFYYQIKNF